MVLVVVLVVVPVVAVRVVDRAAPVVGRVALVVLRRKSKSPRSTAEPFVTRWRGVRLCL